MLKSIWLNLHHIESVVLVEDYSLQMNEHHSRSISKSQDILSSEIDNKQLLNTSRDCKLLVYNETPSISVLANRFEHNLHNKKYTPKMRLLRYRANVEVNMLYKNSFQPYGRVDINTFTRSYYPNMKTSIERYAITYTMRTYRKTVKDSEVHLRW